MLPTVMRWLGLADIGKEEREKEIEEELLVARGRVGRGRQALREIRRKTANYRKTPPITFARAIAAASSFLPKNLTDGLEQTRRTAAVEERPDRCRAQFIFRLLRDGKITDEARRRIEYELDLEEASLANRGQDERRLDLAMTASARDDLLMPVFPSSTTLPRSSMRRISGRCRTAG